MSSNSYKHIQPAKLIKAMRKSLEKERFVHTLGVAYTASSLAMTHGEDIDKALIAGLLHDCAKFIPNDEKIKICEKHNIEISDHEYAVPSLLHAKLGRYMAKHDYGVDDEDILNAIRFHTTGRPGMSLLEKIIYVADFIEPQRRDLSGLDKARKIAFKDLDKCLLVILQNSLDYLHLNKDTIDPTTRDTYIYYKRIEDLKKKIE